jgi:hypothetical protein
MNKPVIIYTDENIRLYATGKEPICHNCCYYRCVEDTPESRHCPLTIARYYHLDYAEMLPLVKTARYWLEQKGWPFNPDEIRRMAEIAAQRKQVIGAAQ